MSDQQDSSTNPSFGEQNYSQQGYGQSGYPQPAGQPQPASGGSSSPYPGTPSNPYGGVPQGYTGTPSHPYGGATPQQYTGTPSHPYGSYGQPGPASQPYGGYGQPGPSSQPYYGQPGPASQPFYGQQTVYTQPPTPKNSRRGLKIALTVGAIVLVLGLIGGGAAVFLIKQVTAPAEAALQFCNDLKTQNYDTAYGLLSSGLQGQYSQSDFHSGVTALDTAEGKVTGCQQAPGSNSYSYSLGASTASVSAQLTRATQGTMNGTLHLKNQNGTWKIDGIDTSLLGVNIGALQAAGAFCTAMQGHDYTTAYTLLDSAQQGAVSKADFVASGTLHDQIDGTITKCALTKVSIGNTDQSARLTIDLNRSKLGDRTGDVTLKLEGSAWKIDSTDTTLNGTDLRPLVVGEQFCVLFAKAKFGVAYGLMSTSFQQAVTKDQFIAGFSTFQGNALQWKCGKPDLATYTVTNDTASVVVPMTLSIPALGPNATTTDSFKVAFVLESSGWRIDDLKSQA